MAVREAHYIRLVRAANHILPFPLTPFPFSLFFMAKVPIYNCARQGATFTSHLPLITYHYYFQRKEPAAQPALISIHYIPNSQ